MNAKTILVTYATRYGSTEEVAKTIAAEMRKAGLEVEIQPMSQVVAFDGCGAVVLGAAIYNGRWHPEAHEFLSRHEASLRRRPIAIFALGPLSKSAAAMKRSRRQLENELQPYSWLKPVAVEMFVGKIDPSKLGFFERLATPASDNRNWAGIRAWAGALASQLQRQRIPEPA